MVIEFDWVLNDDVKNLKSVADGLDRFRENAKHIRGGEQAVDWFTQLNPSEFTAGETLQYKVEDGAIQSLSGDKGTRFRDFLQQFHKLSYVDEDVKLTTPFVHFPPYRGIGAQRLRMSLASQQRWNFELGYARATSRQTMSLIELATFHFASKLRRLESEARTEGVFEEFFKKDPEVQQK